MSEEVETGGLMKFRYGKSARVSKLKPKQKKEIRDAYEQHYQRKRGEKRRKLMIIILIVIVVVGGLLAIFLR